MALMKTHELRELSPEDLKDRLKQLKDDLMHERGLAAMGGAPPNPGKIKALRINIARLATVMREEGEQ